MEDYRKKFQELLRCLFQFDCADLDFGIYRIMNFKRDVIKKFIEKDLPKAIADELSSGVLSDQSQAIKELQEVAGQISKTLGKDALDADGNLAKAYHETPLGKKYLVLKTKAAGGRGQAALEASIFNHLHTFFSRYYQDGDFISKRRYSKRQKYAIPYNGEEVYLHWANNDQYYIKTAEHFRDYTFTAHGVTIHFKLQTANVEQNNVKGDKRFFLPCSKEVGWDEKVGQLTIPFEYRPLTEQEEITYGKANQQDAIIGAALKEVPKQLKKNNKALLALSAERRKNSDGEPISFLEHHLRQYTRRNTSDFFIHKNLKGFLNGELDFYLKNEILNLDEMEAAGEDRAEGWFQITRAIKAVGGRIIDFLEQIENFQKMLWEKRKFITETQYCITIGNIKEDFHVEIAACEPQWAEWKELFHINEAQTDLFSTGKSKKDRRIAFLRAHPMLVMDTKHFEPCFVDRVMTSFDDLDNMIDGLLVHSENFQALNVLLETTREKCKCVYIDPPYNLGGNDFIYKDSYKHSSWLSCLQQSIIRLRECLGNDGSLFCSIGDDETAALKYLLDKHFSASAHYATIAWKARVKPVNVGDAKLRPQQEIEYIHGYEKRIGAAKCYPIYSGAERTYPHELDGRRYRLATILKSNRGVNRRDTMRFEIEGYRPPEDQRWQGGPDFIQNLFDTKHIEFKDGTPFQRYFEDEEGAEHDPFYCFVENELSGTSEGGKNRLNHQVGNQHGFDTIKPIELICYLLKATTEVSHLVIDAFAGSGTTADAVISLNREDEGRRKYILIEVGDHFETVLLPRIKKVTFTPEWKDGKPKRMATREEIERSPRIIKYIRLESYEDALNNIEFDDGSGQKGLKFDDYLLKYMLKWETRKSETLLNAEKLASPFNYTLHIAEGQETKKKVVDIPETFNYLLGLNVKTRRTYQDKDRRYLVYRGQIDHREVAVIWRETEGWAKKDLERDKKFVAEQKLTEDADEVFVNGDSFIPKAKALEPVFKARMFSPVEA